MAHHHHQPPAASSFRGYFPVLCSSSSFSSSGAATGPPTTAEQLLEQQQQQQQQNQQESHLIAAGSPSSQSTVSNNQSPNHHHSYSRSKTSSFKSSDHSRMSTSSSNRQPSLEAADKYYKLHQLQKDQQLQLVREAAQQERERQQQQQQLQLQHDHPAYLKYNSPYSHHHPLNYLPGVAVGGRGYHHHQQAPHLLRHGSMAGRRVDEKEIAAALADVANLAKINPAPPSATTVGSPASRSYGGMKAAYYHYDREEEQQQQQQREEEEVVMEEQQEEEDQAQDESNPQPKPSQPPPRSPPQPRPSPNGYAPPPRNAVAAAVARPPVKKQFYYRNLRSSIGMGIDPVFLQEDATQAAIKAVKDAMERGAIGLGNFGAGHPKTSSPPLRVHIKLGVPPMQQQQQHQQQHDPNGEEYGPQENDPMYVDVLRLAQLMPSHMSIVPPTVEVHVGGLHVSESPTFSPPSAKDGSIQSSICIVVACVAVQEPVIISPATTANTNTNRNPPMAIRDGGPPQRQPFPPNQQHEPPPSSPAQNHTQQQHQQQQRSPSGKQHQQQFSPRHHFQTSPNYNRASPSGKPGVVLLSPQRPPPQQQQQLRKVQPSPRGPAQQQHPEYYYQRDQPHSMKPPPRPSESPRVGAVRVPTTWAEVETQSQEQQQHDYEDQNQNNNNNEAQPMTGVEVQRQQQQQQQSSAMKTRTNSIEMLARISAEIHERQPENARKAEARLEARRILVQQYNNGSLGNYATAALDNDDSPSKQQQQQQHPEDPHGEEENGEDYEEGEHPDDQSHDYHDGRGVDKDNVPGRYNYKKLPPGKTPKNNKRLFVKHTYRDHSHEVPVAGELDLLGPNAPLRTPNAAFPLKLHETLTQIEMDGHDDIIGWLPHGRSFKIHKQKEFVETVLPKYFVMTKKSSFLRQLNLYGFNRLSGIGPDQGSYYHEKFLRGMKFLSRRMTRQKVNGNGIRAAGNPDEEPDFSKFPQCPPRTITLYSTMENNNNTHRPRSPVQDAEHERVLTAQREYLEAQEKEQHEAAAIMIANIPTVQELQDVAVTQQTPSGPVQFTMYNNRAYAITSNISQQLVEHQSTPVVVVEGGPHPPITQSSSKMSGKNSANSSTANASTTFQASFPWKLQRILDKLEAEGNVDVVSWLSHGRAFLVHDVDRFVNELMPMYFNQTKYSSFQRQLHMYHFQRITAGRDKGAYHHPMFRRGEPAMSLQMQRTRVNGKGTRRPGNPDKEPDFYTMSPMAGIPRGTKIEVPTEAEGPPSRAPRSRTSSCADDMLSCNSGDDYP